MIKKIIISIGIILIAVGAGFLISKCFFHNPSVAESCFLEDELNLNKEQKNKVTRLDKSFYTSLIEFRKKLARERITLSRLIGAEIPLQEKIREQLKSINILQAEQQEMVVNHLLKIKDVLTKEQTECFISLITKELCNRCRCETHDDECICGMCE